MFPIKRFLLNVSFTVIFNFEFFLSCDHLFNSHLVSWVEPLHLPSLETIGLAEKEMLCYVTTLPTLVV